MLVSHDRGLQGIESQGTLGSGSQMSELSVGPQYSIEDSFYRTTLWQRGICRLCLSVSVTLRYCIKTAKRGITQIMPHDSHRTLVFFDTLAYLSIQLGHLGHVPPPFGPSTTGRKGGQGASTENVANKKSTQSCHQCRPVAMGEGDKGDRAPR